MQPPGRRSPVRDPGARSAPWRSEEHTSELQSLTNLVCRLLLEKKKKKKKNDTTDTKTKRKAKKTQSASTHATISINKSDTLQTLSDMHKANYCSSLRNSTRS